MFRVGSLNIPAVLGQTEVQHFDYAFGGEFYIGGLEIAMNDALLVRGFKRAGDLFGDLQPLLQRNRALPDSLRQRWTLDQLHHQVIRPDVVQVADVGVIQQRGDGVDFARETIAEALSGNLDRYFATHAGIAGPVYLAHPARANPREDLVGSQASPGRERHACWNYSTSPFGRGRPEDGHTTPA